MRPRVSAAARRDRAKSPVPAKHPWQPPSVPANAALVADSAAPRQCCNPIAINAGRNCASHAQGPPMRFPTLHLTGLLISLAIAPAAMAQRAPLPNIIYPGPSPPDEL